MTLQSSTSCVNDSLKIYDGGLLKKTYCGNYIYVLEYKSIESTVVLVFQSDATVTDRGFKVQYTTSVKRKYQINCLGFAPQMPVFRRPITHNFKTLQIIRVLMRVFRVDIVFLNGHDGELKC